LLDRELETGSVSEKLRTDEERLYSGQITSPRELGDLQHETEYLKRRQADLEDRQLEAMISLEEATTQLAVANEELVVVEAAWKAENADLHQEYDALKQELAQLLTQRKRIAANVSKGDMSEYDSLRRLRKGLAVVAVQKATCTVCNVSVPQRDVERAAQEDELYYCSGCDRILYVPED
jgi:predicted  nucleic acid-binding Zn-ribbon protein